MHEHMRLLVSLKPFRALCPMAFSAEILSDRLTRLENMQGSDPGFALLAVLSFVESLLREYLDDFSPRTSMPELMQRFGESYFKPGTYRLSADRSAVELLHYQRLANNVRHHFAKISAEELQAALFRLFAFIRRLNIPGDEISGQLKRIEQSLDVWNSRKSHFEDFQKLLETGFELTRSLQENSLLRVQLDGRISEINRMRQSGPSETFNELPEDNSRESSYIRHLRRLSMYARSRRDFERQLIEASDEQNAVLRRIPSEGDFLVSGSAGTGKTLLLILALANYVRNHAGELDFSAAVERVSLLTYTTTLTKYNRYLAGLIGDSSLEIRYSTVDALLNRLMEEQLDGRSILYSTEDFLPMFLQAYHPDCGLDAPDALDEIENYLFAHNISRGIYIDEAVLRRGREKPLSLDQRRSIWNQRDRFSQLMEDTHRYTRNFGRIRLLENIEQRRSLGTFTPPYKKLFIDEIQDLNLADIMLLKNICGGGLVMAGDRDQSIFIGGFSFESAGVMLSRGNSAILRRNFRNSEGIQRFAAGLRETEDPSALSHRTGPPVELFPHAAADEGLQRVVERCDFAISELGYSPESLVILSPRGNELKGIRQLLEQRGINAFPVRGRQFDFSQTPGVRLSTLHSVKGLDFAGVLTYIPSDIYTGKHYDQRLASNLLYVASTRAMELLWFFCEEGSPVHRQLSAALENGYSPRSKS